MSNRPRINCSHVNRPIVKHPLINRSRVNYPHVNRPRGNCPRVNNPHIIVITEMTPRENDIQLRSQQTHNPGSGIQSRGLGRPEPMRRAFAGRVQCLGGPPWDPSTCTFAYFCRTLGRFDLGVETPALHKRRDAKTTRRGFSNLSRETETLTRPLAAYQKSQLQSALNSSNR